eukprot:scaffold57761_cov62-Phaeocystis_antarctica.AAC.3
MATSGTTPEPPPTRSSGTPRRASETQSRRAGGAGIGPMTRIRRRWSPPVSSGAVELVRVLDADLLTRVASPRVQRLRLVTCTCTMSEEPPVRQAAERRDCKVEAASSPVLVRLGRAGGLILVFERGAHASFPNELNAVGARGCSRGCTALRRPSLRDDERREARVRRRGSDACHHRDGRARDVGAEGEVCCIEDDAGRCIAETCDVDTEPLARAWLPRVPCGCRVAAVWLPCGCRVAAVWLPCGCRVAAVWPPWLRRGGVVRRTCGPVDASEHEEDEMQLVRREEDGVVVPALGLEEDGVVVPAEAPERGQPQHEAGRPPEESQAVRSATLEVASSSTRGIGWAPNGLASLRQSVELSGAVRRALRRHRSRAGALPRGHFDHAAPRDEAGQVVDVRARAAIEPISHLLSEDRPAAQ